MLATRASKLARVQKLLSTNTFAMTTSGETHQSLLSAVAADACQMTTGLMVGVDERIIPTGVESEM